MLRVLAAAVGFFVSGPAFAQPLPAHLPTHDVAVTYRVDAPGRKGVPREARLAYSAESGRIRLESPDLPGFLIVDPARDRMTMVMTIARVFTQRPLQRSAAAGFLADADAHFTPVGTDVVAGRRCTVWQVQAREAQGTACLTSDGVLLRGQGQNSHGVGGSVQAIAIEDAPQSPDLFVTPPGFRLLDLSNLRLSR
jgi:hypothetical protein